MIILVAMGGSALNFALARAQAAEALSLAQSPITDAALAYAVSGRWPDASVPEDPGDIPGKYVQRVSPGTGGRVHMFFLSDAHPRLRDRHATTAPIVGGDGATLRWHLVEDDTLDGESVDPFLIPHAWRLENKEP